MRSSPWSPRHGARDVNRAAYGAQSGNQELARAGVASYSIGRIRLSRSAARIRQVSAAVA